MFLRLNQAMFGAVAAAAILAAASQTAQSAQDHAVTVYRGASATTVSFPTGGPVLVQRGAAAKTTAYAAIKATPRTVLAGERLWVVDTEAGQLTTCALKNSIQVGRKDIRCFSRALPASLRPRVD